MIGVNPLYFMLPCTVTCSYAFMLPVATAPNAIVYTAAKMNPIDMVDGRNRNDRRFDAINY